MHGRTTIVIAHRPGTIALADTVVLLDDGRVAATGTHDELLATQPALPRRARRDGPSRIADGDDDVERRRTRSREATDVRHGRRDQRRGPPRHATRPSAVLRRPREMAAPFRRTVARRVWRSSRCRRRQRSSARCSSGTASTTGSATATRGRSTSPSSLYVVVAIVAYLGGRQQYVFVNRAGEGFLRILRIRVFDHIQTPVAGVLRPQQVGRARVADDRRHRVAGRARAVGPAAVRRGGDPARRSRWSCCSSCRGS